jgi:hypothetical protein
MKIAVSGSVGIGKTTLVSQLAEQLNLPVINESYEDFFGEKAFDLPADELKEIFYQLLEFKNKKEKDYGSYISDRCPVDLLNLWLEVGLWRKGNDTRVFYERCKSYIADYDFIIFLPWAVLPLKQLDELKNHRRRVLNSWVQLKNHANMFGLAGLMLGEQKIIQVPDSILDIQQRVDFVLDKISAEN